MVAGGYRLQAVGRELPQLFGQCFGFLRRTFAVIHPRVYIPEIQARLQPSLYLLAAAAVVVAAVQSVVALAYGHVDGVAGAGEYFKIVHARQCFVQTERMLLGIIHLPSLLKRAVGAYVGHHDQIILIEHAFVGHFELGGKSCLGDVALNASAKGHAVGGEPVGK